MQVALSLNPGGTERLLVELVARLHAEIPMMVCCLDEPGAWAPEIEALGVEVRALRRQPGFRPALGGRVADAARRHRATAIHAHQYSPFVYSCVSRVWPWSAPVIYTEHGRLSDAPPSRKRRAANRFLAKIPAKVYAVSEDLKAHMVREGFAPNAVGIIYNGTAVGPLPDAAARIRVRRMLSVDDETVVIGTVARLDPVKDLGTLIRAVATVTRGSPHRAGEPDRRAPMALVIVGDGPERQRLEDLAVELGVGPHVRFLGHRDDARLWLAGCDVYVNSSISEGVSLTILEGMAAGLPVVATRVGGTPEVIDATCGRLVPSRDPLALAEALLDLASSPILRRELGQSGRRRVETRFTLDRMVSEYREAYLHLNTALRRGATTKGSR